MINFQLAPAFRHSLNGLICIFKPAGEGTRKMVETLKINLARDLNSMICYFEEDAFPNHNILIPNKWLPSSSSSSPVLNSNTNKNIKTENVVDKHRYLSLGNTKSSDHLELSLEQNVNDVNVSQLPASSLEKLKKVNEEQKLILGERYIPSDFKISYIDGLSKQSSGVLMLGIGKSGMESIENLGLSQYLRVCHVKGRFGMCTDDFSPEGKFIERATFKHISQSKLDKLCASAQSAFTREMYRYSGISPDSQEAFELAASGMIRPSKRNSPPILYGIKCVDFQPPDFTLEIHSINEHCQFFRKLVHDMAVQLKSRAICTGIRRLRYGHFGINNTLARPQWTIENVLKNIESNQEILVSELT